MSGVICSGNLPFKFLRQLTPARLSSETFNKTYFHHFFSLIIITIFRYIISVCSLSPCGRAFVLRLIVKRKCFSFIFEKCKWVHIFFNLILSCSTCSVCQCKIKKFLYKTCFLLHYQHRSFNPCRKVSILRLIIGKENISGFRKEVKKQKLKKNLYLNLLFISFR